jgi:HAD superfamily hydrolase (TIGR01509 family)
VAFFFLSDSNNTAAEYTRMNQTSLAQAESGADWQLAIFDCDGVLVDSEELTHRVLIEALAELGIDLDLERAIGLFMGNTLQQNVAVIEDLLGRPLPPGFFPEWRELLYARFRSEPVQMVEGVGEVLDQLQMPVCVVSNGPLRKIETTLGVTGLLRRFEGRLYSSESGLPGKPAPDLFLAAARDFGVEPERTLVVEDSPKGVAGAVAAGMRVFAYCGAAYADAAQLEQAGAVTFANMRDLPALIRERRPR